MDELAGTTWRDPGFLASSKAFARDFLHFAGRRALLASILIGAGALVESIGLILLVPLLTVVFGADKQGGRLYHAATAAFRTFGIESQFGRLAVLVGIFAVLVLLRSRVTTRRDVFLAELQIGFLEARRKDIATALAAARWEQVMRLRHARIAHLMSGDVQRLGSGLQFLIQSCVSLVMLTAQCLLAFLLSPALAAVSLALLAVTAAVLLPAMARARKLGRIVTKANLELLNATSQYLGGLKQAIGQNRQSDFVRKFANMLDVLSKAQIDNLRQNSLSRAGLAALTAIVGSGIVLVGYGWFHVPGPTLIALLLVISRMGGPVGQIQQGMQSFAHALPAYDKVLELERELAALPHGCQSGATSLPQGAVVFTQVGYHYAEDDEDGRTRGVTNIDLTLAPGEFLGIGGPSGAGKTTFADLLVGLLTPQSGKITIGGVELNRAALAAWGDSLSYVSQEPFLFHDTVRGNLLWANPSATERDMWQALDLAQADELVRRMEHGLDTVVGERGTLVSGGERQRLALARAILRRPRLLVLDEATNAIDVATERAILERLAALATRPAIVMIAHRPESLALCERVLRLEAGQLTD